MPTWNSTAPVGGWNAFDSYDAMPETDAVKLCNWIPAAGYCRSRGGSLEYASVPTGAVRTLIGVQAAGTQKLLAAAAGKIYDATAGGVLGVAEELGTGFTNDDWQHTSHTGRQVLVNGADAPQVYTASAGTLAAATLSAAPGETETLTATDLISVNTFKGRVFYIPEDSQGFWFTAAGSFQGEMNYFDLGGQLTKGGKLMFMISWTLDSGEGIDDLAVFVFSTGEVLIYQGDDPASATAWSLAGRFRIGEPLGRRAHERVGGDEILLTKDGYLNLSAALQNGRYSEASAYSLKIIRAAKQSAALYGANFGWDAILYSKGNLFIVNVPLGSGVAEQHVRNTNTGAWTKFTGWNANCLEVLEEELYFGTDDSKIVKADIGYNDRGEYITLEAVPAYAHPTQRTSPALLQGVNVVSTFTYPEYVSVEGLSDYEQPGSPIIDLPPAGAEGEWDVSSWDEAQWAEEAGDDTVTIKGWRPCMADGYALSVQIKQATADQQIKWYSTTYLWEPLAGI